VIVHASFWGAAIALATFKRILLRFYFSHAAFGSVGAKVAGIQPL